MPGLVKIGMTTRTPEERAKEIYQSTGVATQFIVIFEIFVNNCYQCEKDIHSYLGKKGFRVNPDREFFQISPTDAINTVTKIANKYQTETDQSLADNNQTTFTEGTDSGDINSYIGLSDYYYDQFFTQKDYDLFNNSIKCSSSYFDYYLNSNLENINDIIKDHFIEFIKRIIRLNIYFKHSTCIPQKYLPLVHSYKEDIKRSCENIFRNIYPQDTTIDYNDEFDKYLLEILSCESHSSLSFFHYIENSKTKAEEELKRKKQEEQAELLEYCKNKLTRFMGQDFYKDFTPEDIIEHAYLTRVLDNVERRMKRFSTDTEIDTIKNSITSALYHHEKEMFWVAQHYLRGSLPFNKNAKSAKYWYQRAANMGNKDALWIIKHSF